MTKRGFYGTILSLTIEVQESEEMETNPYVVWELCVIVIALLLIRGVLGEIAASLKKIADKD